MINIRPIKDTDHPSILKIADSLPEWFNDHARTEYIPTDLKHQMGFLAESCDGVIGFITLFVSEGRLNIGWLGVKKGCQRKGAGSLLIHKAEEFGRQMQLNELATYTLGEGVDYPPYEMTRAFYRKHGFQVYQRSQTDNPGCPEEIRISKKIV